MSTTTTNTPFNPEWKMKMHVSGDTMRSLYRDDKLGVQWESWCKRTGFYPCVKYSKGGQAYFIDGDKTEYKTEKDLIAALTKAREMALDRPTE